MTLWQSLTGSPTCAVWAGALFVALPSCRPTATPVESSLRVVDPNGAGTIRCATQRDDLTGSGFLFCTAREITITLDRRPLAVWRIPLNRSGQPCCAATAPCCGPQQPGCPCALFELMEAKHAYPSSCKLEGNQWRCIIERTASSEASGPGAGS